MIEMGNSSEDKKITNTTEFPDDSETYVGRVSYSTI